MSYRLQQLPYAEDTAELFAPFAGEPWALFLDSGGLDRFDLIAARPRTTLITRGETTWIEGPDGVRQSRTSPFALLREALGPAQAGIPGLPFSGGAIGYFGYDLARLLERLPDRHGQADPFPDLAFGLYDWAIVIDHQTHTATLAGLEGRLDHARWQALLDRLQRPQASPAPPRPLHAIEPPGARPDWPDYQSAFTAIQRYILEGDCYQINFARRYQAAASGDPWQGYRALRRQSPAPYGAYFQLPQGQLLCNSPERFLSLRDGRVSTSPIKGTRPRHADPQRDEAALRDLLASPKDRAENLMIVDLLRNDLGRGCAYGSIQVERLFRPASFARVHHLVSDISGQPRPGEDALSLLAHCFPGGSITGAPKRRAMEIIEELEVARRGPYCGSLAYIGFDGAMDSNILIRTLMHQAGRLWFWAGGGIVADSEAAAEFAETEQKASALLDLLR